jgi:hypothetical protein
MDCVIAHENGQKRKEGKGNAEERSVTQKTKRVEEEEAEQSCVL